MNKAKLSGREGQPLRKVLLIDDDDSLRRVTEYSLHSAGFHVLSAANGKQGLACFPCRFTAGRDYRYPDAGTIRL